VTRELSGEPCTAEPPGTPAAPRDARKRGRDGDGGHVGDHDAGDADMGDAGAGGAGAGGADAAPGTPGGAGGLAQRPRQEPGPGPAGEAGAGALPDWDPPHTRPGEVLVFLYGGDDLRIGDVVEFAGVFTVTPEIGASHLHPAAGDDDPFADETVALCPPTSQVPRVHAVLHRRAGGPAPPAGPPPAAAAPALRAQALAALGAALGGDALAAEYVLCQALTRVHARPDKSPLGSHCLNLTGVPGTGAAGPSPLSASRRGAALARALGALLPRVLPLGLTLRGLSSHRWAPWKDYQTGRVRGRVLRPADGTHVLLDETVLEAGQLAGAGVANLRALAALIQKQAVDYDLEYYQLEMEVDAPVTILSTGKSVLPSSTVLPLRAAGAGGGAAPDAALDAALGRADLPAVRAFLAAARERAAEHRLADGVAEAVEADMTSARAADRSVGAADFDRWLSLARALCASHGEAELTLPRWEEVRGMERARMERLAGGGR